MPATSSPSAVSSNNRCPKCGIIKKSGTLSCCARGGSWFKKCGDAGDAQFDYTWAEGIQACKDSPASVSLRSPVKVMFHHVGVNVYPVNTTKLRNATQQQMNIYGLGSVPNAVTTGSQDCVRPAKVAVCILFLFIISHLQT